MSTSQAVVNGQAEGMLRWRLLRFLSPAFSRLTCLACLPQAPPISTVLYSEAGHPRAVTQAVPCTAHCQQPRVRPSMRLRTIKGETIRSGWGGMQLGLSVT